MIPAVYVKHFTFFYLIFNKIVFLFQNEFYSRKQIPVLKEIIKLILLRIYLILEINPLSFHVYFQLK